MAKSGDLVKTRYLGITNHIKIAQETSGEAWRASKQGTHHV